MKGNFQRLRRHHFDPAELQSLRIEVQATNGDPQARIFEVRLLRVVLPPRLPCARRRILLPTDQYGYST